MEKKVDTYAFVIVNRVHVEKKRAVQFIFLQGKDKSLNLIFIDFLITYFEEAAIRKHGFKNAERYVLYGMFLTI